MNRLSIAATYGAGAALASFALSLALYVINTNLMVEWWVSTATLVLTFVLLVMACVQVRKQEGGVLSFGGAWGTSMQAAVVAQFGGVALSALLFMVIAPELPAILSDLTIAKSSAMMENFGLSAELVEQQMEEARDQIESAFTFIGMFKSSLWSLLFWAVISLLVAAITKKKPKTEFV